MFSSWFISYLPPGRWGGGPLLWHLRAALVLLLAEQGSLWASGPPGARLRFCYYLNPCQVASVGPQSPKASPAGLQPTGGLGLDCVGGPVRRPALPAPSEAPLFSANCDQGLADAHSWPGCHPHQGSLPRALGGPLPRLGADW